MTEFRKTTETVAVGAWNLVAGAARPLSQRGAYAVPIRVVFGPLRMLAATVIRVPGPGDEDDWLDAGLFSEVRSEAAEEADEIIESIKHRVREVIHVAQLGSKPPPPA